PVQIPTAHAAALVHASPSSTAHAAPIGAASQSALQQPVARSAAGSQLSPGSTIPFPQSAIARTPPMPKLLSVPYGTKTVSPETSGRPIADDGTGYVASRVPVAASTVKNCDDASSFCAFVPAYTTPSATPTDDQLLPISCVQSVAPVAASNAWRCSGAARHGAAAPHASSLVQPIAWF